jgi:hypothetical protein
MLNVLKWWAFWLALGALLCVFGCSADTSGLAPSVGYRGPVVGFDAGTGIDTQAAVDTQTPQMSDALISTDLFVATDLSAETHKMPEAAIDTQPACPTVTVQLNPTTLTWTARASATTTDAFCFRTCDMVSGIGWMDFLGRKITINGQATSFPFIDPANAADLNAGGRANTGFGTQVDGAYNVQVSAGLHANATVIWHGVSVLCP